MKWLPDIASVEPGWGLERRMTLPEVLADADYLNDELAAAESWHFWFCARRQLVLWAIRSYFPHARRLLDVGCGTGFVLDGMLRTTVGADLAGCDNRFEAVSRSKLRLNNTRFFQADAQRLPVRRRFDAITALDVIEHLDDDTAALAEMFRALNPGGGLVVTVPQHRWLWSPADEFSCHRRRYSRSELTGTMRAVGFDIRHCTSFFSTTLPLMALRRLRWRWQTFDAAAELRISKTLNIAVDALLKPEWALIRAGVSLPVGGSLLVVAERPPS